MQPLGKSLLFLFLGFLLFLFASSVWAGTEYPTKPITLIVGYPPGSSSDITARALASAAEEVLKQPVIVLNKPGGSASLALALIAQAKPDGYTIGLIYAGAATVLPHVEKVAYDPLKDFTYIANVYSYAEALVVRADSPWKNFKEFEDYVRQNPKEAKFGTYGVYVIPTLVMESVGRQSGIKWEVVPFKGDSDSIIALLGGHINAAASVSIYAPHVRAGKLRILALMGHKRSPEFTYAPTFKDLGYELLVGGVGVGVGTPKWLAEPIRRKLEEVFAKAVKSPPFLEVLKKFALIEDYKNSTDLTKFVTESFGHHGELIRRMGLEELKR